MTVWRMHLDIEPPYLIIKPEMTEGDFYRLADEDSNWEYLGGRIVMHSPASDRHEDLFSFLNYLLRGFLETRGGGVVRGSRYPMRLDAHWSPEPDLMIIREQRRQLMTRRFLDGAADFVIEIASDSDPRLDEREKLPRYRDAGIDEIWVIDPFDRRLRVDTKLADGYATRQLSAGRVGALVLPGFWIDAEWLWTEPLPPAIGCLQQILG